MTFKRSTSTLHYRKLVVIATEGAKTEPKYFAMFGSQSLTVHVEPPQGRTKSAPHQVLGQALKYVRKNGRRHSDEIWVVVDREEKPEREGQLDDVFAQCQTNRYTVDPGVRGQSAQRGVSFSSARSTACFTCGRSFSTSTWPFSKYGKYLRNRRKHSFCPATPCPSSKCSNSQYSNCGLLTAK